jgi:hypothetical protein
VDSKDGALILSLCVSGETPKLLCLQLRYDPSASACGDSTNTGSYACVMCVNMDTSPQPARLSPSGTLHAELAVVTVKGEQTPRYQQLFVTILMTRESRRNLLLVVHAATAETSRH